MKSKPSLSNAISYDARSTNVNPNKNSSARILRSPPIQPQIIPQYKQEDSFSFDTASNAKASNTKKSLSKSKQIRLLEQEKESLRQRINELINVQQDNDLLKQQNANFKRLYLQSVHCNISKPRIPANDSIIIIDDDDKIKKTLNIIPKMIMVMNIIKKFMALLSTAFMIDCKLTGEGHFGIECLDQVRVTSVDNSYHKKPLIYQNGERVSIDELNEKEECLLPLCYVHVFIHQH